MIKISLTTKDNVIKSLVGQGTTTYKFALDSLHPLINKLGIQRKVQDPKFYDRLKRDILNGCVMPPITIAFITEDLNYIESLDNNILQEYIIKNIKNAFILDGIQRINTLHRAINEATNLDPSIFEHPLYFSVLICESMDSLLYRMITLNNGQRPMTTRHQIEILTSNFFDFDDIDLPIQPEKTPVRKKGFFKQADFTLAYLAFLSNSITIDNQKIIESRLDELLAFRILENDLSKDNLEFSKVLDFLGKLIQDAYLKEWLRNVNNLIGLCSSIRKSFEIIKNHDVNRIKNVIENFESALSSFNMSKIKLGSARRASSSALFSDFSSFEDLNSLEIMEKIAPVI